MTRFSFSHLRREIDCPWRRLTLPPREQAAPDEEYREDEVRIDDRVKLSGQPSSGRNRCGTIRLADERRAPESPIGHRL